MKGVSAKGVFKSVSLCAALYLLCLLLVTALVMKGVLKEEHLVPGCIVCAGISSFVAAFIHRVHGKDASILTSLIFGGGQYPLVLLAGFFSYGGLLLARSLAVLAAIMLGIVAANVLYARAGFGRKKRGKRRRTNK